MRDRQPPPKPDLKDAMEREIQRAESGPRRRQQPNAVRDFLRAHPMLTLALILGIGIGLYVLLDRAVVTDEEQIRETIYAVAQGLENEDEDLVMAQFSRDFQEDGGVDYDFLETRLPVLLHHANWGVSKPKLEGIQVTDDTASVSEIYVIVSAGGRAVPSRWRLRLQRETGEDGEDRWRIVGAIPLSVQNRNVDGLMDVIRRYND